MKHASQQIATYQSQDVLNGYTIEYIKRVKIWKITPVEDNGKACQNLEQSKQKSIQLKSVNNNNIHTYMYILCSLYVV